MLCLEWQAQQLKPWGPLNLPHKVPLPIRGLSTLPWMARPKKSLSWLQCSSTTLGAQAHP